MMPLFENEENAALRAELAATKGREERMREVLVGIAAHCACTCEEIWTSRGMHHPNECKSYLVEDIDAALAEKPEGVER